MQLLYRLSNIRILGNECLKAKKLRYCLSAKLTQLENYFHVARVYRNFVLLSDEITVKNPSLRGDI